MSVINDNKYLEEAIYKYAHEFKDIKNIISFINEEYQKIDSPIRDLFYNYSYYDIANGLLGNCIFLSEMFYQTGKETYQYYTHNIFKLGISRNGIEKIDNPGLWSGLSGVCFSLETLNSNGQYQEVINNCDEILKKLIHDKIKEVKCNLENQNVKMGDYDLMEGMVGIVQYILTYKKADIDFQNILKEISEYFIDLTKSTDIKNKKVPNWLIKAEHQFLDNEKTKFANGNFNQGVSHGICGVLISLVSLYKLNKNPEIQQAIERIVNWYYDTKSSHRDYFVWEKKLSFESLQNVISYNEKQVNLSWCYGDLMIIYSLLCANEILNDEKIETFLNDCCTKYDQSQIEIDLLSPTICHGFAGTLLVIKKIQLKKGEQILSDLYKKLTEKLTSSFDNTSRFGFWDVEEYNGKLNYLNKYSLLSGNSGVYLTLNYLIKGTVKTNWMSLFLLDN
ncbi:lanthionine synthetase C family protein [Solibacillus isronensis]|uniref:lanthionine synthetase C family protein n=1 Tax=Solibacillus isronensis TaxID=412383 RepID=UPI0015919929|nr:lanthionine synthetase C family protein [Solibacillus isronensis]